MKLVSFKALVLVVGLATVALGLAACGGGGSSSGTEASTTSAASEPAASETESSSEGGTDTFVAQAEKTVDEFYKGKYYGLPSSSPKPESGKDLWIITCSESQVECVTAAKETERAATAVGWKSTIVDGELNPSVEGQYIQRAISAGADAIVLVGADCSALKAPLTQAKAAGIVTFGSYGEQCEPPLFTAVSTEADLPTNRGKEKISSPVKTQWMITQTGGEAKVIDIALAGVATTEASDKGFRDEMAGCEGCEIVDTVKLNPTQLPEVGTLFAQSLAAHPEANAVFMWDGSILAQGVASAIERSPNADELAIVGATCEGGEIPLMKKGLDVGCLGYEQGQTAYQAIDVINRAFHGVPEEELPMDGIGLLMVDKEHNLPKGEKFEAPIDYRTEYEELWGVK